MSQPLEYEQVTYNDPGGAQMGKSATEKIAFYGATPVVRPVISGIVSSATCLSTIVTALANLGLVTDSTTP
jgi:hypothetical protein